MPVALGAAAVLALAGCGTQRPGSRADTDTDAGHGPVGTDTLCPSGTPRYGAPPTEAPPTEAPSATLPPHTSRTPLPLPAGTPARDGVRVTGLYGVPRSDGCAPARLSADFTVTNHGKTAMRYAITLGFRTESQGAAHTVTQTVPSVEPGRTVRGTAVTGELPGPAATVTDVSVLKVRSVPVDEAPSAGGACPASGVRAYTDQGDAAMGLRVLSLYLENCGTRAYRLDGRPELRVLDAGHAPVPGVEVVPGDRIATGTGTGADGTSRPVTLQPGERAYTVLVWRNTTEAGDPVDAPYVRVRPRPGARPVTLTPELDLGTTGKLGVGPWKRDSGRR
ncbi:lipoprotein [Streptomyces alanosinicus]|uniref:Lipoprotein n=1 Tax=Streptomyces alanosinicus TaxID=68171 RepID=A0A919D0P6_9ACTN|nr:lipoprotein [Streptomyces alanosinicus]